MIQWVQFTTPSTEQTNTGCGLGVLIRIAWVLTVLLFRSVFKRPTEEYEVTEYLVFEEGEALPAYQSAEEEKAELSKATV